MAPGAKRKTASPPTIGLALSGGGARGLAHIPVVAARDELGRKPAAIAGTSIGAIVGAGCAAGMSGAEMRAYATELLRLRAEVFARLWKVRPRGMRDLMAGVGATFGQFDAARVFEEFLPKSLPRQFSDLAVPLRLVATDFYGWQEVILDQGPLIPAIAASAALPLLFRPVVIGGRVLVDGGMCNPLPFDILADECDIVVAVDVGGGPVGAGSRVPGPTETVFGAMQLFSQSILREKMRWARPPEIFVRAPQDGFRTLDFLKVEAIIKSAEPLKDEIKHKLEQALALPAPRP